MKLLRKLALGVSAASAIVLIACGTPTPVDYSHVDVVEGPEFPAGSTMEAMHKKGSIRIGVAYDKPYFGVRGLNGELQGFDIEMSRLVAGRLGIEPEEITFVEAVSSNREPFLTQGKVDLIIATYTINDNRKKVVSFAGPYMVAGQALLAGPNSPETMTGIDSAAGARVCGVTGSTGYENIRENYPEVAENLVGFDTYSKCGDALRNGQVDAVTADNTTLAGIISHHEGQGFHVIGEPFSEEPYGIGLAHDDHEFRAWLNDVLEESFETGEWKRAWERTAGQVLDAPPAPPQIERY